MYKNLLTLSLTAVFILQFNSQASAVKDSCSQSFTDLLNKVTTLQNTLNKCKSKLHPETGWGSYCETNIDSDIDHVKLASKQAYQDCGAASQ